MSTDPDTLVARARELAMLADGVLSEDHPQQAIALAQVSQAYTALATYTMTRDVWAGNAQVAEETAERERLMQQTAERAVAAQREMLDRTPLRTTEETVLTTEPDPAPAHNGERLHELILAWSEQKGHPITGGDAQSLAWYLDCAEVSAP